MSTDLIGTRFGCRVVISATQQGKRLRGDARRRPRVACQCDCGAIDVVEVRKLLAGQSSRCVNCLNAERRTHGATSATSPEYRTWCAMKQRCAGQTNRKHIYEGLPIDDRWLGSNGFKNFLVDMGPKPTPRHSLDRKDNTLGYSPENCRWATATQQARNRDNSATMTANGVTKLQVEWAEELGIKYHTLRKRLALGWTPEEVVAGRRVVPMPNGRAEGTLEVGGETKTWSAWAEIAGVKKNTLRTRVKMLGWTPHEAVFGREVPHREQCGSSPSHVLIA